LVVIGFTVTTTHAKRVELVAVAVAVAFWDVSTSALVNLARTVAYAARVIRAYAIVDVVADAILIAVHSAVTTTHTDNIKLVAVAVAVTLWDVSASTFVDLARSVAYAARVIRTYAVIHIVANTIGIFVRFAVTTTHAKRVELVAIAVAVTGRDVSTSTFVDLTRTVAYAACVVRADAVVHVVADAIGIRVRCTRPTTFTKRVELVAVAIAVTGGNIRTSTLVGLARATTNSACIKFQT
jgi:hypothetical protein